MRSFPYEFAIKRRLRFFPEVPQSVTGDVLEIGPGRGDFLLVSAEAHPEQRFVAIELKHRRYRKLTERVTTRGLSNVLLVFGDARVVVEQMVPPSTFARIYVLFPDPWPKRRHEPMRLLSTSFLQILAERLRPGGELVVATDDPAYRAWVQKNAEPVDMLESTATTDSGEGLLDNWAPTFYEQKWRNEGRSITYLSYRRVAGD